MTDDPLLRPQLGTVGVWTPRPLTPADAAEIEQLGYGALWVGGSPDGELTFVEPILAVTTTLQVATGIVNIWNSNASQVAESYRRIEDAFPGRFLLGVGVGHSERTSQYRKPYAALVDYLDELDAGLVPIHRRVLAALGPKVLQLSRARSAGAHPYLTTPEHTAVARQLLGTTAYLAPEQKVVLSSSPTEARAVARQSIAVYLDRSNYVNNWRRLGFGDEDFVKPGSDRLIDKIVAYGTPEQIARRLREHREAGADHVAVQVLGTGNEGPMSTLRELAASLDLARDV